MASLAWEHAADCHAEGTVRPVANVLRGTATLQLCGHCLTRHIDKLTGQGWDVIPIQHTAGKGADVESTAPHHGLGRIDG